MESMALNQRTWLLLLWFPLALLQSTSPYCSFTPLHSLCPHENVGKSCGNQVQYRGVTPKDAATIVDFHNTFRSQVAMGRETRGATGPQPHASNMMMMEWDDELAIIAQRDADQCIFGKECVDCRRVSRFGVGQNLLVIYQNKFNAQITWSRVVKTWYHEVTHFEPNHVNLFQFSMNVSRYTQMVWWDTHKIGCGFGMFLDNGWWKKIYTCNYGPGGNILSSEMYQPGDPCSACPKDTACSARYPGLCEPISESSSAPPRLNLVSQFDQGGDTTAHLRQRRESDFEMFEGEASHFPDQPLDDERTLLKDLIPFLKKIGKTAQVIRASSAKTIQKIRDEVLPPGYRPIILYRTRSGKLMELDADTLLPQNKTQEAPPREEPRKLLLCDLDVSPCEFIRVGGNWSVAHGPSEGSYTETSLRVGERALLMVQTPVPAPTTDSLCISVSHRRQLIEANYINSTLPELSIGVLPTGGQVISKTLGGTAGLWEMGVVTINNLKVSSLVIVNVGPVSNLATVAIDAILVTDGRCCISGLC
ncbi:uncharacterized protein LOC135202264 [Macrobrachium nipponense]|uniref:uncharacterized protein LOC135202264 n=1 Tax=Macrobrachium nipponense TaxID=159736 RepID=UPI0030C7A230